VEIRESDLIRSGGGEVEYEFEYGSEYYLGNTTLGVDLNSCSSAARSKAPASWRSTQPDRSLCRFSERVRFVSSSRYDFDDLVLASKSC